MRETIIFEVFIVIEDGIHRYYASKIERRGFNVYCFLPGLGMHYSLHETGEAHFQPEGKAGKNGEASVILQQGEAGIPIKGGFMTKSLRDLGSACRICALAYPIGSLSHDFPEFTRNTEECFVIDIRSFPKGTTFVNVEVWAVPATNKAGFKPANSTGQTFLLYEKVAQDDLQIWMYAEPF